MRVIIIVLLALIMASCGLTDGPYSSPRFSQWPGQKIQTLTTAWGKPTQITTALNGNWEYHYPAKNHVPCEAIFEINPKDIILSVQEKGPQCPKALWQNR